MPYVTVDGPSVIWKPLGATAQSVQEPTDLSMHAVRGKGVGC